MLEIFLQGHILSTGGAALIFDVRNIVVGSHPDHGWSRHKTEMGSAKDRRLVIANHLDQPNHLANQQQVLDFAVTFCSDKMLDQNQFAEPNQHVLTVFIQSILYSAGVELLVEMNFQ